MRRWGCRLGRFWFVWTDLWADRHGLDVTYSDRRLLSIGSELWRGDVKDTEAKR